MSTPGRVRLFTGPANPRVQHQSLTTEDPALHARVSTASETAIDKVDPAAVCGCPVPGGAAC